LPEAFPSGFLNVDKPSGPTSHDVVNSVRRALSIKKVGHTGTLDPLASGVLIICIGQATRLSEYVMASTKRYRAHIHLGVTTDTYDAEGKIVTEHPIDHLQREDVERALPGLIGSIEQFPPMYSAIKQDGRKLYDLARAGKIVDREPRRVRIDSIEIVEWSLPQLVLDVTCSAGTYVRSLAFDLGEVLGVGAHLAGLVRLASGKFMLEDAVTLPALLDSSDWQRHLLPMDYPLSHLAEVQADITEADHVIHGRPFGSTEAPDGCLARVYDHARSLIAIAKSDGSRWHPHKVFSS
jgi:tRNA pseudouridine55 synthase